MLTMMGAVLISCSVHGAVEQMLRELFRAVLVAMVVSCGAGRLVAVVDVDVSHTSSYPKLSVRGGKGAVRLDSGMARAEAEDGAWNAERYVKLLYVYPLLPCRRQHSTLIPDDVWENSAAAFSVIYYGRVRSYEYQSWRRVADLVLSWLCCLLLPFRLVFRVPRPGSRRPREQSFGRPATWSAFASTNAAQSKLFVVVFKIFDASFGGDWAVARGRLTRVLADPTAVTLTPLLNRTAVQLRALIAERRFVSPLSVCVVLCPSVCLAARPP